MVEPLAAYVVIVFNEDGDNFRRRHSLGIGNQRACAVKPRTTADGLYSYLVHVAGLYKWHPHGHDI